MNRNKQNNNNNMDKTNITQVSAFNGMKFPEFDNRLVNFRDFEYFLPTNKEVDIFLEIKKLYDNSSLHSSILNNLIRQVNGTGLIGATPADDAIIKAFNYNSILNKCIFDFVVFGGTYLEIFWNDEHTKILKLNHLKYPQIRIGNYDKNIYLNDKISVYYHCSNWKKWMENEIVPLRYFSVDPKSDKHQVLPILYNNFLDIYPKPYYYSGWKWISIDCKLSEFYLSNIEKVFSPNTMFVIPGNLDTEQKEDLENIFGSNFTGPTGKKNIVFNPPTPEMEPKIIKFNNEDDGDKYHKWVELISQQLVSLHNLPSTTLAGISTPGSLSSASELQNAQKIYNANMVYPFRNYFIDAFTELNEYMIYPLSQIEIENIALEFVDTQPANAFEIKKIEK